MSLSFKQNNTNTHCSKQKKKKKKNKEKEEKEKKEKNLKKSESFQWCCWYFQFFFLFYWLRFLYYVVCFMLFIYICFAIMVVHKNPYILSCIVKTARNGKEKQRKKCDTHRISDKRKWRSLRCEQFVKMWHKKQDILCFVFLKI